LRDLELGTGHRVTPHVRVRLDLGGIAKGYAVDRAIDALRTAGCVGGMVNAGGDLAVFGAREHEIGCRRGDGRSRIVKLRNAALATSEVANEDRTAEHRGYYDGSGRLAQVAGYAAVTAPSAAVADGLTKCVLAAAPHVSAALLRAFDARRVAGEES
jgi:thiamine biosynthesis lipoprotein